MLKKQVAALMIMMKFCHAIFFLLALILHRVTGSQEPIPRDSGHKTVVEVKVGVFTVGGATVYRRAQSDNLVMPIGQ